MIPPTQPFPRERTATDTGLSEHLLSLLSSVVGYFQARLALAGIEAKEAVTLYGLAAGFLAAAAGLLVFGYIFLWIGIIGLIAHYGKVNWGWVTLAVGVLHFIGTAACVWFATLKWGQPVFTATMNEFRKDQEWLSSPRRTANRN